MRPRVKSTVILSILGLSLALNAALAIGYLRGAADGPDGLAPRVAGKAFCLLDRLQLDEDQRRRLADMRRKMHEKRAVYWQHANGLKTELAGTISAAPAQRDVLDGLLQRYAQNQASMQRAVADHLVGVNAMLRPGQREAFQTLLRTEMFRGIHSAASSPAGAP